MEKSKLDPETESDRHRAFEKKLFWKFDKSTSKNHEVLQ